MEFQIYKSTQQIRKEKSTQMLFVDVGKSYLTQTFEIIIFMHVHS